MSEAKNCENKVAIAWIPGLKGIGNNIEGNEKYKLAKDTAITKGRKIKLKLCVYEYVVNGNL